MCEADYNINEHEGHVASKYRRYFLGNVTWMFSNKLDVDFMQNGHSNLRTYLCLF